MAPDTVTDSLSGQLGRALGRSMALMQDAGFTVAFCEGQCPNCTHRPYKRTIWLYRHLRNKHG